MGKRVWQEAQRSAWDWNRATSKAITKLLRHDLHAEVSAQGFIDTGGWISVAEVIKVPSVAAWGLTKEQVRQLALNQGRKTRLAYDGHEDKIRVQESSRGMARRLLQRWTSGRSWTL